MAPSAGHLHGPDVPAEAANGAAFQIERQGDEVWLAGELRLVDAGAIWRELVHATRDVRGSIALDLSRVVVIDGAVMALLVALRAQLSARDVPAVLTGANERTEPLVQLYAAREAPVHEVPRSPERAIARLGRAFVVVRDELAGMLEFFGSLALAIVSLVRNPRSGHWKEIPTLLERVGADAVPIVLVINGLVGFAMAFQSAEQLELYGASEFVADLVGIAMTRELAPLMTAIVVCGRSGAGFAAEIASMKINEEVDALRTLGLRPLAWLVLPRMIAMLLVLPALTLLADFVGIAGGLIVATVDLDISPYGYLVQTKTALHGRDVATGLIKTCAFAFAIVLIACQQGLAATGGAESIGRRTTSTVVTSLFVLVLLDAIITVIFRIFGV